MGQTSEVWHGGTRLRVRLSAGAGEVFRGMRGPTAAFPHGCKPKPALSKPRGLRSPANESFLCPLGRWCQRLQARRSPSRWPTLWWRRPL